MAVLAVLIGGIITLINPITQLRRARDAERKNTLFQLRSALEVFYNDNNSYPVTSGWFSSEPSDVVTNNGGNWIPGLAPTYIQKLPRDPEGGPGDPALTAGCSSWKRAYLYQSDGQNYALLAHCSPIPATWDSTYGLFDPNRPNHAWKVCAGAGCGW
jgi:type II secretory pathway pseudopilin PulG